MNAAGAVALDTFDRGPSEQDIFTRFPPLKELVKSIGVVGSPSSFGDQRHLRVPDIMEFVYSDQYLNRPTLYPRQATLLKIIFLQDELFTDYDWQVIGEWSDGFKPPVVNPELSSMHYEGDWGINPDIIQRMQWLKEREHRWFPVVCAVQGRRSGKGHIGSIAGAYVLWHFICSANPQEVYGLNEGKRLAAQVFAGKKAQARDNQWRDIANILLTAPCFEPFMSVPLGESMTLKSAHDDTRIDMQKVQTSMDLATFEIVPKEATMMAARGPASFMQFWDEMAHMVATGVSRSAEEVWRTANPSLSQFKKDSFIYCGSSPWEMLGKFYDLVRASLEFNPATFEPLDPTILTIQLASWDIYLDWERTVNGDFVIAPRRRSWVTINQVDNPPYQPVIGPTYSHQHIGAIEEYDEKHQRDERANPEAFRVEYRCLDPDTRVLTADLRWVRIDDLSEGDEVIGIDEEPPGDGKQRRMRRSVVKAKWSNDAEAYRISFTDGTSVVCSGNHRWFSTTPSSPGGYRWRYLYAEPGARMSRQAIKVGDMIAHLVDPWDVDRSWEAGYLAGAYDGEGTALGFPGSEFRITFVQNPNEVLDATLGYLREKGFHPRYQKKHADPDSDAAAANRSVAQAHLIEGLSECLRFVGQIGGHKMLRQVTQSWEGRALGRKGGRSSFKTVADIEPLGVRRLVDIETTTGTFVAEGLISHNSKWATAQDSYFDPAHVDRMFRPWGGLALAQLDEGIPAKINYIAHGDPGKTSSNFGFAIAHVVPDPDGHEIPHVIFDRVHAWTPGDFQTTDARGDIRYEMDYISIEEQIKRWCQGFLFTDLSFDQWNSISFTQRLSRYLGEISYKGSHVWERNTTGPLNWTTAETMKVAMSLDRVHMPYLELAELEFKFLRKLPGDKVDHPDTGPVTTKDVYDAVSIVVHKAIGQQIASAYGAQFSALRIGTGLPGLAAQQSGNRAPGDSTGRPLSSPSVQEMFSRNRGTRSGPRPVPGQIQPRRPGRSY